MALEAAMQACEQIPGLTIWQHGLDIAAEYKNLIQRLQANDQSLPIELLRSWKMIDFLLIDSQLAEEYHIWHDCGKFLCLEIDEMGKKHFKNHAQKSAEIWQRCGGNSQIEWFLLHDMDFHTLRNEALDPIIADNRSATLLLTAWAELFANAKQFGGQTSDSFKIKQKRLIQATKRWMLKWIK